jgi:hypothetical protein
MRIHGTPSREQESECVKDDPVPRLQENKGIRSQAGLAYVAILLLLTVLSTMAMAFLFKVGIETAATETRGKSMQVDYLAESAANHALWRLLNEPGFNPAADTYSMHSLGNGRYGYKVRMPTETTFATVATVGAVGDSVAHQSYVQYIIPSNVLLAYGRTTTPAIQYRRMIGANWTDPADTPDVPVPNVNWVEMEGCPVRKEIIMATIDGQDDINLAVWDGTSWGNPHVFSQNADKAKKCFDIAYESQSGDALVVGRTGGTTTVSYNIWDGTAWLHGTPQPAFNLASGALTLVAMASCPGNDSILIAAVNWNVGLELFLWNGSAFSSLGTLATSLDGDNHGIAEIVYEQQSGDAFIFWSATGGIHYRVWNGASLSAENTIPAFTADVSCIRAASDPTSDHIIVAGVDKFCDVTVAIWDGDAWTDYREVEIAAANSNLQVMDVAWEASGEDALVAWCPWTVTNVNFMSWRKGTALADSTIQVGPNFGQTLWLMRLFSISGSEKIVLLGQTNTEKVSYCLWNGNQLKGDPPILLATVTGQSVLDFDVAEADVPRSGGTGSFTQLPPTVDAGPDQTISLPSVATLDGTVSDDGLPDPPATVTTTWSKVSGPGTVTFGDASQVDTTAAFSEAGTYVLRLTADDSEAAASDEVTIEVNIGVSADLCMGIVGYWQLDEATGTKAIDWSGNGNNGTLTDMDPATDWIAGHIAGGLDFDGVNDHVLVPHNDTLSTRTFSIAAWIRPSALSGWQILACKGTSSTAVNYYLGTNNDELAIGFYNGGWTEFQTTNVNLSINNWYHIAGTFDYLTGDAAIYLNGSPVLNDTTATSPVANSDDLTIGRSPFGEYWHGILDDVRIYNRVLGPSEMSQLHASTVGGCGVGGSLLFVVSDASSLSTQENARKALMQGWGWTVSLIDDGDTEANFDSAAAANDMAYISQEAVATTLGSKLNNTLIGVVNENKDMIDDFGFATGVSMGGGMPTLNVDMSHYITSVFAANPVAPYVANDWYQIANEPVAAGVDPVGTWVEAPWTDKPALMALSQCAQLIDGWNAAGRRVQIPWGSGQGCTPVALAKLSDDAKTIMRRAVEWAAGALHPLLFVVDDASNLSSQDNAKKSLMEGWGWTVKPISASAAQADFDAAAASADVAYVSDEIVGSELGTKLKAKTIGVVNEDPALHNVFGFSSVRTLSTGNPSLDTEAAHYITSPFGGSTVLALFTSDQAIGASSGTLPSGLEIIGRWASGSLSSLGGLLVLETGATISGGGTAAGRRVQMPWGGQEGVSVIDVNSLTSDGLTIMKRAIEWAACTSGGGGSDEEPPTPDPMTWASPPAAEDPFSITMTATTATDPSGVEYYFECTTGGGNDSGWQDSPKYVDTGLTPETQYTYRVKARDKSSSHNETGWSSEESATTNSNVIYVFDITMGYGTAPGGKYFGRATVWIKTEDGANVSGAVVTGDWSGAVSETSMGSTGSDGKVTLESSTVKNGGTFTFTVTDVSKSGYVYNPALNVETSDSITAP